MTHQRRSAKFSSLYRISPSLINGCLGNLLLALIILSLTKKTKKLGLLASSRSLLSQIPPYHLDQHHLPLPQYNLLHPPPVLPLHQHLARLPARVQCKDQVRAQVQLLTLTLVRVEV
jgi:hypothetical protein